MNIDTSKILVYVILINLVFGTLDSIQDMIDSGNTECGYHDIIDKINPGYFLFCESFKSRY